jgi:hypothetical protein
VHLSLRAQRTTVGACPSGLCGAPVPGRTAVSSGRALSGRSYGSGCPRGALRRRSNRTRWHRFRCGRRLQGETRPLRQHRHLADGHPKAESRWSASSPGPTRLDQRQDRRVDHGSASPRHNATLATGPVPEHAWPMSAYDLSTRTQPHRGRDRSRLRRDAAEVTGLASPIEPRSRGTRNSLQLLRRRG